MARYEEGVDDAVNLHGNWSHQKKKLGLSLRLDHLTDLIGIKPQLCPLDDIPHKIVPFHGAVNRPVNVSILVISFVCADAYTLVNNVSVMLGLSPVSLD